MPIPAPSPTLFDLVWKVIDQLEVPRLVTFGGAIVADAGIVMVLVGFLFGRRWLRGLGVAIWLFLVTIVFVFSLMIMADAARKPYNWGLAALMAGLVCFLAAAEWALRRLKRR